jgi:hypothetical protein
VISSTEVDAGAAHGGSKSEGDSWFPGATVFARSLVLLSWVFVAVLALHVGAALWRPSVSSDTLPRWDAARYGAAGAHVAHAVRHLDVVDFVRAVEGLDLWGPVFPLIEAAAFVPFGSSYQAAKGLMVVLWALTVVAGYWAGRQLGGAGADATGALVAGLVAVSPAFQLFSMLVMLEVPGALLLFLAVGTYVRSLRTSRPRDFTIACLAAVLLFFLKFNYGLAWLVPFALSEIWLAAGSMKELRIRCVSRLQRARWRSPWRLFLLVYAAGLVALALLGTRVTDLTGETTRSISLGTPLYALYLLVIARALSRPRRSWAGLKAWYAAATSRQRKRALVILLPIAVWMLPPSHTRGFVRVLENRSAGPSFWTTEGLLFYPRAFLHDFSPAVAVGVACLVLVACSVVVWARLSRGHGVVVLALLLGLAATLVHPYKLERFLFPVVPLLWLAAAAALAAAIEWVARTRLKMLAGPVVAALILGVAILLPVDRARIAAVPATNEVPAGVRPVVLAVAKEAARVHGSVLVGYWNDFSPGLVEWEGWQAVRAFVAGDMPRPADHVLRDAGAERMPEVAAQQRALHAILLLDLHPGGSAYRVGWEQENSWLEPARRALEADPRWTMTSEQTFPESGYRLRVYERAPQPAVHHRG